MVHHAEVIKQLEYYGDPSIMPTDAKIGTHTVEVLRQVEGANVVDDGSVGGDAWFRSVITSVEVKTRLNVDLNWIIKGNHAFYPMEVMHAILKDRFRSNIAGHWVSMTAVIDGSSWPTL
jgi:hypothetical protein